MNTLPINFEFNTNTIRVIEIDGEPWFVASDVCKALGIANMSAAISILGNSDVRNHRLSTTGRARPNKIISEGGLYKLTFRSTKTAAREFTDWVTGTVLPAIRKDGGYIVGEEKVATGEMGERYVLKRPELLSRALVAVGHDQSALSTTYHIVRLAISE